MVIGNAYLYIMVVMGKDVDKGYEVETMDNKTNIQPGVPSTTIKIGMTMVPTITDLTKIKLMYTGNLLDLVFPTK